MGEDKQRRGVLGDINAAVAFLSQSWRSTDRSLRRATLGMWVLGLASTILGFLGDGTGFWATRPFATNLLTSLTAFFFAVPVALLVLQNVQQRIAGRAERLTAIAVLEDATNELASIFALLHPPISEGRDSDSAPVSIEALRGAIAQLTAAVEASAVPETREVLTDVIDMWKRAPTIQRLAEGIRRSQAIVTRLREVVRPQFLKLGLEWRLDGEIDQLNVDVRLDAEDIAEAVTSWPTRVEQRLLMRPGSHHLEAYSLSREADGLARQANSMCVHLNQVTIAADAALSDLGRIG
ncbi:hypothetical protein [Nonomuraea sp. JJY05]|uniref:hypothetical protein n=1 Tax=Nonomuraea sp. JJY05 TaxID=3350255 RepID=UPI00373F332C